MVNQTTALERSAGGGDASKGASVLVISLAVLSVAFRFYTRLFTRQGLKADDWLIMAAVIATMTSSCITIYGNSVNPNGIAVVENTDPNFVYSEDDHLYLKLSFITAILYFVIAGPTKLGILFMYRRIFNVSSAFRYANYVAMSLVVGWWIGCIAATLFNCVPLDYVWINSLADPKYCFNFNIFWMVTGAVEVPLDVIILALPIGSVMRLKLSTRYKLTSAGIFLLGSFVIVTGLVKTILGYSDGRTPAVANSELWATVHTVAIVCASLPVYKPLLRRIAGTKFVSKFLTLLHIRRSVKNSVTGSSVVRSTSENCAVGVKIDKYMAKPRPAFSCEFEMDERPLVPLKTWQPGHDE